MRLFVFCIFFAISSEQFCLIAIVPILSIRITCTLLNLTWLTPCIHFRIVLFYYCFPFGIYLYYFLVPFTCSVASGQVVVFRLFSAARVSSLLAARTTTCRNYRDALYLGIWKQGMATVSPLIKGTAHPGHPATYSL